MSKNKYTGFWMPAHIVGNPQLSLAEKIILARIASFPNGTFMTNRNLADQLQLDYRNMKRLLLRLRDRSLITIHVMHNGLRLLRTVKLAQEGGEGEKHPGGEGEKHPTEITDRDYIQTCSSGDEPKTRPKPASNTSGTTHAGMFVSKQGLGIGELGETAAPADPLADYDPDDCAWALAEVGKSPIIAFPRKAASGLLRKRNEDRAAKRYIRA